MASGDAGAGEAADAVKNNVRSRPTHDRRSNVVWLVAASPVFFPVARETWGRWLEVSVPPRNRRRGLESTRMVCTMR